MKFGKTAQLVLAIGIFAIAIIFLYRMSQEREAEHEQLTTQIAAAQAILPDLESEKADLEGQLKQLQVEMNQAKVSLSKGKANFPDGIDSIRYDELLFQMARDRDLEMMRLSTSEPGTKSEGDFTFTVTTFDMEVHGAVADIIDFIDAIAIGDDFTTAAVELVSINVPKPLTLQEKEGLTEQEGRRGRRGRRGRGTRVAVSYYKNEYLHL